MTDTTPTPAPTSLTARAVITALDDLARTREAAGQPVIRVTEVGQNQLWAAQYSRVTRPRSFLTSGGLGAMGFGLPAAIGAQIAAPDALVLNISGDGSFQMNVQELATAMQEQLPLIIIVLNNGGLGLVRQWQHLLCNDRYVASNFDATTPDLPALAAAYGALGLRATTPAEFDAALTRALALRATTPKPALIDCRISPQEAVTMQGDNQ